MRIQWRGLELPTRVMRDDGADTPTYGRFVAEPFERGFGTTVGNSLRRILLSSLEGAAVTHVKIKGADHEFTSLPGVVEDVTEIILNIKSLIVRSSADEPKTMRVSARGEKGKSIEVRAGGIEADPAIEIVNKDQILATLTDAVDFEVEMTIGRGRSYVTADDHKAEEEEEEQIIGVIPVDSVYSPVTRVRYRVEDTRVGQRTNYDRLVMEIWTNGTVTPEMALVEAAKILRKHLNPFIQFFELGSGLALEGKEQEHAPADGETDSSLEEKYAMPLSRLDLSVRAANCLVSAEIHTVGDLVKWDVPQLLKLRSFGRTSLREVKRKLADLGLSLGSDSEGPADGADSLPVGEVVAEVSGGFGPSALSPLASGDGGTLPAGQLPAPRPPLPAPPPTEGASNADQPAPLSPVDAETEPGMGMAGGDTGESRANEGVQSV